MTDLSFIKSLTIERADGSVETIGSTKLRMAAGPGMGVVLSDANTIEISANTPDSETDTELYDKYEKLINGGNGYYKGVPYNFSGAPYYYTSIEGVKPLDGHSFLLTDKCTHFGLFVNNENPTLSDADTGSPINGALDVTDVCAPCVDCSDYSKLYEYMDALKDALADKKNRIVRYTADNSRQNNILPLYMQSSLYWNNAVQSTAWRCYAQADGGEVNAACMLTNHFDSAIPSGLKLSAFFTDIPSVGIPKSYFIDFNSSSGVSATIEASPSVPSSPVEDAGWSADFNTKEVTVSADTADMAVGDYVSIILSSSAVLPTGSYRITSMSSAGFVIYVADMLASGDSSGTCTWARIVKVTASVDGAIDIGESVKLYIAAVAPRYVGSYGKAKVVFENSVADTFAGFPSTKSVVSNTMVVVDIGGWGQ